MVNEVAITKKKTWRGGRGKCEAGESPAH